MDTNGHLPTNGHSLANNHSLTNGHPSANGHSSANCQNGSSSNNGTNGRSSTNGHSSANESFTSNHNAMENVHSASNGFSSSNGHASSNKSNNGENGSRSPSDLDTYQAINGHTSIDGHSTVNGHSSTITFSINGILSTNEIKSPKDDTGQNGNQNGSDKKPIPKIFHPQTDFKNNMTTAERTLAQTSRYSIPFQVKINAGETLNANGHLKRDYNGQSRVQNFHPPDNPPELSPELRADYNANYYNRFDKYDSRPSNEWVHEQRIAPPHVVRSRGSGNNSSTGRFRPPPFFETVLALRKRLYYLGGKRFPIDEPPMDRNIHKLWRAVEKHKVTYSLQHYFYVASLSNRCFDLVEAINYKVSRGLLEGSREKELNQSYFNFLYGKTEDERYRFLCLLEKGEISPKNFTKSKHQHPPNQIHQVNCPTCHKCEVIVKSLTDEKEEIKKQYASLKRRYDEIMSTQQDNKDEPETTEDADT